MKKRYTILFALLTLWALSLPAQITCDDPLIVIEDALDNYATGDVTMQSPNWGLWPGASTGGLVTTEVFRSAPNSLKIDGNIADQDALLLLGGQETGHYVLDWRMLVYDSTKAYFNLQHEMPTASEGFWGFDVFMEGGTGRLVKYDGSDEVTFRYPSDAWFSLFLFIDIDSDYARLVVNEVTVGAWAFSSADGDPSSQMHSINFYPLDETYSYYLDDIRLREIPAAESGQYCYTAEVIEEPGFYAVPELSCFGGSYDQGGNGSGFLAHWFEYTPDRDGVMAISSCGAGVDTRLWIMTGDCENIRIVGVNDDQCPIGSSGSEWASYREAVVNAGQKYYIMWDDAWEKDPFAFELTLSEDEPEVGRFCETAELIYPGQHEVLSIDGDAAVAGPNINNTSSSTTNYSKSKWYQFIPTADGLMGISSCGLAASDTHFFVYTGECESFELLNLVAQNDNGCEPGELTSALDSIPVVAGETYYIEWIDRWMDSGEDLFIWELTFDAEAAAEVTFEVDMQLENVDPQGAFIAGAFSDFKSLPMSQVGSTQVYTVTLPINHNGDYTYKFQNGPGGWENINTSVGDDCTTGDFGDRGLTVAEEASLDTDAVCFGYCVSCATVSTDELGLKGDFTLFPNPARDQVTVEYELEEAIGPLTFRLIDMLGRVVLEQREDSAREGTVSLSTAALPAGAYQLQVQAGAHSAIARTLLIQ